MWSLIAALASLPLSIVADVIAHRPLGTSVYFIHGTNWLTILGLNLKEYPLNYPLWYVRCLIGLVTASYFLNWMLSRFKYVWLAFLCAAYFFVNEFMLDGWNICLGHMACGVFFFSVGMALRKFKAHIASALHKPVLVSGVFGVAFLTVKC